MRCGKNPPEKSSKLLFNHIFCQTANSILLKMQIFQIPHLQSETKDFCWKICHISGVLLWYQCKQHMVCCFTSPGSRVPAEGAMLMSESLGGRKENSLGATRVMASLVCGSIGCLDWLWLVSRLIREIMVVEWSPTAVAPNWTREWESSNGGLTTTAWHDRWKSLMTKKNKLFSSIMYKYMWDLALIEPDTPSISGVYWSYKSTNKLDIWHLIYTQYRIRRWPVNSRFAAELETVLFGFAGTENQINLQGLLWKQSAKAIIRLDLNKL